MLEEIYNNLTAISFFLIGLLWLLYKLKWLSKCFEWYKSRVPDPYGIIFPSILTLVLPFLVHAFSQQTVPEIFKLFIPVGTFFLGQVTISFQKEKERQEENKKIYSSIAHEIKENLKILQRNNILILQELTLIPNKRYLITPIFFS